MFLDMTTCNSILSYIFKIVNQSQAIHVYSQAMKIHLSQPMRDALLKVDSFKLSERGQVAIKVPNQLWIFIYLEINNH